MDRSFHFEDIYRISKIDGDNVELCKIKFIVNQFISVSDDLFSSEIRIEHNLNCPLISIFNFSVLKGNTGSPLTITDFMLPPRLRGCHLSIFILNKVHGYLLDEIKKAQPKIRGSLIERDNSLSRDKLWQKAIGLDAGYQDSVFSVDSRGNGRFQGRFVNVGESWRKSIIAKVIN